MTLTPLGDIKVPVPKPEETYQIDLLDRSYNFMGLKKLLAAADHDKAGERNADLVARDEAEREAARSLLSSLTLRHLYDHPLTDVRGNVDSVMVANYDIDLGAFETVADWSLGKFKDFLLTEPEEKIKPLGRALTGVMAAAVTKLMDTHELIYVARKIHNVTQARTSLGMPGRLSSRLQPNHPVDDLRGITFLSYLGLSMGSGDCLLGLNPAIDTVENVASVLTHLDKIRRKTGAPTQICVLSHLKTQLECLKQGVPVEVMFQSLAGTESTNLTEFDISVELLDRAYQAMAEQGPLLKEGAKQFMYFETGQGSEFTYGKHEGIDMATLEALCYGLARRYDPFMVNNVTGFIGPETHADNFEMIISCLQDHFMGKLLGLPMGMAPCYTLHSKITLEGQQMATEMLTAAGANYYMDVYLNTDRMLAYFDTSCHDDQTLREIYNKRPTDEFTAWAVEKGIYRTDESTGELKRGPNWGKPRIFCESDAELQELRESTPSIFGLENAGPRPGNAVSRELRSNQAVARSAVESELDISKFGDPKEFRGVTTQATSKNDHLNSPDRGASLSDESTRELKPEGASIQILISDGLSAEAVHYNLGELLPVLRDGFRARGKEVGKPFVARYGRVKLGEAVAKSTDCDLVILFIGERPGGSALASRSLSCYFVYQLRNPEVQKLAAQSSGHSDISFEYTVLSNIYSGGLPPVEAGSVIVDTACDILKHQAAGNRLLSKKQASN